MKTFARLGMLIAVLGAIVYPVRLDGIPNLFPGGLPNLIPAGTATPTGDSAVGPTPSATGGETIFTQAPTSTIDATPRVTPNPTPTLPPTVAPTPVRTPMPTPTATIATGAWPTVRHIYQIVFENTESTKIIGNLSGARYLNSLITAYEVATNYTAVSKPSQPNYLAMFAGSTLGVTDNDNHDLSAANLADQIEASGRDWRVAAQNYPLGCFTGASASGGADGSGTYTRKHNPAISFTQISGDPTRCAKITDFSHFNPAISNYWMIVPNLCISMHDCSIKTGDDWLKAFLPTILDSSAFKADGLIIITWDEGSTSIGGGGKVATIFISPTGKIVFSSPTAHNHYSLLRTIQGLWGLPCLAKTCSANSMREFFP
ncbi:MAG: alkaline phosphatase family protein [Chloroflexota bacterium]